MRGIISDKETKVMPSKKQLDRAISHNITVAAYKNAKPENVGVLIENLFDKERLDEMLRFRSTKREAGRPKQQEKRIEEILMSNIVSAEGAGDQASRVSAYGIEINEGQRVVPLYEGFGEGPGTFLTPYEHRFVVAFVPLNNAAEAARIASNPEDREKTRNWNKVGNDMMRRPAVQKAIGYMQKKLCVAAALDSVEIISNIREIAAMALAAGKFDAAIKANQILGEHLGMFGKNTNMKNVTPTNIDIFKSGEELVDNKNDIKDMATKLGITFKDITPTNET